METNRWDPNGANKKESEAFEEFVFQKLQPYGYNITLITTTIGQLTIGESVEGVEIKYDKKSIKSPNIYIEIAEKSNPSNRYYIPSGIYRNDNTNTYVIGNWNEVWIFDKNYLKEITKNKGITETPTSQGILLCKALIETNNKCKHIRFDVDEFWLK